MELTLKRARMLSEKTQLEVAKHIGVSVDTYRKIEKNPDAATIEQAKIISSFLGISYDTIFFGINSSLTRLSSALPQ